MNKPLLEFNSLNEGILIKRYKRFLADIQLDDGREITAHCPNTGPMKGLITKEARVRVSFSPSPKRKLSWTWEQVEVVSVDNYKTWVGINTLLSNRLIKKVIEENLLTDFIGEIDFIKTEKPYGINNKSRIDFFLKPKSSNPDKRNIYIEVKNTTWMPQNVALFPDTVTLRGQKHLNELMAIMPESKSILIPCISRPDAEYFASGDEADPDYGRLFKEAISKGLIVAPCSFDFHKDHISWNNFIPLFKY